MFFIDFIYIFNRGKNAAMKMKKPRLLFLTSVFGSINLFSVLVANEHMDFFKSIRIHNCPLWNLYLQHIFGTAPWLLVQIYRLYVYAGAFKLVDSRQKKIEFFLTGLLIEIPVIFISILILYANADAYDPLSDSCHIRTGWKIAIMGWIIWCILLTFYQVRRFSSKIQNVYIGEHNEWIDAIMAGFLIFIVYAFVNIFLGFDKAPWRCTATGLLCALHLFCKLRITLPAIWSIYFLNDPTFNDVIMEDLNSADITESSITSVASLMLHEDVFQQFKDWCRKQDINTFSFGSYLRNYDKEISSDIIINIYELLLEWRYKYNERTAEGHNAMYLNIIQRCIRDSPLQIPLKLVNEYSEGIVSGPNFRNSFSLGAISTNTNNEQAAHLFQQKNNELPSNKFMALESHYTSFIDYIYFQSFKKTQLSHILQNPQEEEIKKDLLIH